MSYTKEQTDLLIAASPVTYADAADFAETFDKAHRSVISKVKSLEAAGEAVYIRKPVPAAKPAKPTKAELVASIDEALGTDLSGLVRADADTLTALLDAVS